MTNFQRKRFLKNRHLDWNAVEWRSFDNAQDDNTIKRSLLQLRYTPLENDDLP